MTFRVGVHEFGGLKQALKDSQQRHHSTAFQSFAKQKQSYWFSRDFRKEHEGYAEALREADRTLVVHGGYLVNVISAKPDVATCSLASLIQELDAAAYLGAKFLNIHAGTHPDVLTNAKSIHEKLGSALRRALDGDFNTTLLLETMPGSSKMSQFGWDLGQLAALVGELQDEGYRIGVTFDTCHTNAAGYDFSSSKEAYDSFWYNYFAYFKQAPAAFHVNGATYLMGSKKDGHATLAGHLSPNGRPLEDVSINPQVFKWIREDERFSESVHILETPQFAFDTDLALYCDGTVDKRLYPVYQQ